MSGLPSAGAAPIPAPGPSRWARSLHLVPPRMDERTPSRRVAQREAAYRHALAAGDVAAAAVAYAAAVLVLNEDPLRWTALALAPPVVLLAQLFGLYDRDELVIRKTTIEEVPALFFLATVYTLILWFAGDLFVAQGLDRAEGAVLLALTTVALVLSRAAVRRFVSASVPAERCLVIGNEPDYRRLVERVATSPLSAHLVGRLELDSWVGPDRETSPRDRDARLAALTSVVRDLHVDRAIIISDDETPDVMLELIRTVKALGVRVSVLPRVLEVVGSAVAYDDLYGITLMGVRRFGLTRSSAMVKRAFDLVIATVVTVLTSPLLATVAVCVKLDSPGPVFFRQQRIGRDGAPFAMFKFRSMVDGADQLRAELAAHNETDGLFKIAADPRITRTGRFLRRTSLDELPQILNVLRGEMSIVGPRPLVVDEDAKVLGLDRRRLALTPGMTGPWQILGSASGRVPLGEMVKIDYLYVANWALWGDVKIVLRTIPYVLFRRGV